MQSTDAPPSTDATPEPLAHAGHRLAFMQPVPRNLVHRASVAEVLLTDSARLDDTTFLVAAQWPRDHALYHPDAAGRADPLLFAETIRQMFVYLAHTYLAVPLTHHFIGDALDFSLDDTAPLNVGATPLNVVLDARWTWHGSRPPRRYGMRLDVVLSVGGRVCGSGMISGVAVDDRMYALLRHKDARGRTVPDGDTVGVPWVPRQVTPAAVGRLRTKDMVLERDPVDLDWLLRVDTNHAIYFDHPSDHVPVMVALEGFRQLGYLVVNEGLWDSPLALVSSRVQCLAFGELDQPARLVVEEAAEPTGSASLRRLRVSIHQGGRPFAVGTTVWSRPAGPPEPPEPGPRVERVERVEPKPGGTRPLIPSQRGRR
ncbi:ScbA/BarX family gamma-butyrolactone biosynthesis protein [Actinacidiphila rubida]|uniref:A-factor biosynthesis hotdog domain-containing protein n=1 Tax=Actinacidiphila rubida TaxID=310780 RepID=A0A1H8KB44_9ACTN|nr:ScbA/BarX family gamma-butyrolactone biosynthesis protein [Actinacidiphila rubida]SEN90144.1 A-factor biosynthesis hotdog domain-containing protein [Actinacidiphila rubida]